MVVFRSQENSTVGLMSRIKNEATVWVAAQAKYLAISDYVSTRVTDFLVPPLCGIYISLMYQ